MKQLADLEEYKAVLKAGKPKYRGGYNNLYLSVDAINRYLSMGRLYYEENDAGLLFFADEEQYFGMYMRCNPEVKFAVGSHSKPLVVNNVYKGSEKPDSLLRMEKTLEESGFSLYDQSVQILMNPMKNKSVIYKKCEQSLAFLARANIRIIYAEESQLDEILRLRDAEPELDPYHRIYQTRQEMLDDIRKGYYRCAINAKGEICAAQHFSVENGTIQGDWLAVMEEYKVKYGIGIAMAYHSYVYAIEHEISSYFGWVVKDNVKSIKYHKAIGYEMSGKLSDAWLLV